MRPHSALANQTPEEFRAQHIAVAASADNGQNFAQDSTHDWKEIGLKSLRRNRGSFVIGSTAKSCGSYWIPYLR